MQRPVFILGFHKSGTTLLRSLLDGVPGVFAIPIETHIFEHLGFWVDYEIRRQLPRQLDFDQIMTRNIEDLKYSNQSDTQKNTRGGDSVEGGKWNIEKFMEYFYANAQQPFEQTNIRAFIDAYFDAIHLALTGTLPDPSVRFVEKTVENAEFVGYLQKAYPDAVFIHIVRNPYAAVVASRKFRTTRNRYPYLGTILRAMENSFYHAFHNPQLHENYHMIRYEDLVQDTEITMQQIAEFTGIPYNPAMLIPSTLGSPWKGNSMSGKGFDGISQAPVYAWKKDIFPLEAALINLLLPHVLTRFGYETHPTASSVYLPCKRETIPMYIANRFFWLTSKNRRTSTVNT